MKNGEQMTALMIAAQKDYSECVEILLNYEGGMS